MGSRAPRPAPKGPKPPASPAPPPPGHGVLRSQIARLKLVLADRIDRHDRDGKALLLARDEIDRLKAENVILQAAAGELEETAFYARSRTNEAIVKLRESRAEVERLRAELADERDNYDALRERSLLSMRQRNEARAEVERLRAAPAAIACHAPSHRLCGRCGGNVFPSHACTWCGSADHLAVAPPKHVPMTIDRAVEILNRHRYLGYDGWAVDGDRPDTATANGVYSVTFSMAIKAAQSIEREILARSALVGSFSSPGGR